MHDKNFLLDCLLNRMVELKIAAIFNFDRREQNRFCSLAPCTAIALQWRWSETFRNFLKPLGILRDLLKIPFRCQMLRFLDHWHENQLTAERRSMAPALTWSFAFSFRLQTEVLTEVFTETLTEALTETLTEVLIETLHGSSCWGTYQKPLTETLSRHVRKPSPNHFHC